LRNFFKRNFYPIFCIVQGYEVVAKNKTVKKAVKKAPSRRRIKITSRKPFQRRSAPKRKVSPKRKPAPKALFSWSDSEEE
jgi:hypothetical protein